MVDMWFMNMPQTCYEAGIQKVHRRYTGSIQNTDRVFKKHTEGTQEGFNQGEINLVKYWYFFC